MVVAVVSAAREDVGSAETAVAAGFAVVAVVGDHAAV